MKKKLLFNLILIPFLLCNVNGLAADNPLDFICNFGKKVMIGAGIGVGIYSVPVILASGVSLSAVASIASSSTAILQGAILGAATKTFTDTGLQCLLPQNYDRKHPIKNSIISTALSGICISNYNASLELSAPIIGSLTGHLTQAVIENSIEKLEQKTNLQFPWLKSGISLMGNIAGSIVGSYVGRIASNALWNHKFLVANSQTDHTVILDKPTNQTEILQDKHFRLCNPAYPDYEKPFISDQSDIELSDLKNILLGNEQIPARAVQFTHHYQAESPLRNGEVRVNEHGEFVAPWMQEFIPKELHRCDSNIENPGFNHVYALNEEEINNAVIKSQICNGFLLSGGYDIHSDYYSLMYDYGKQNHFSEVNITRSALKERLFTEAFSFRNGEERFYNIPSKFSDDTLVITENCSFSMKKLKENHETLYCLDPSDNLKKATYFDCPKSFDKACYESCFVPTESPDNPNYNLGASIGAPIVSMSVIGITGIIVGFVVRKFIKNKPNKRISSEESPLVER